MFVHILTHQFNCGFFYPLSLSFLSRKYIFLEPHIYKVIFQGEFNELGFKAIRQLVIALKSQLSLSGARLIRHLAYLPAENQINFTLSDDTDVLPPFSTFFLSQMFLIFIY